MGISLILAGLLSAGGVMPSPRKTSRRNPRSSLLPPTLLLRPFVAADESADTMRATDFWTYKSENAHTITYTEEGEQVTVRPR